jgi:hypothetical protein
MKLVSLRQFLNFDNDVFLGYVTTLFRLQMLYSVE